MKIMVLGGGSNQIDLIKKIKDMGHEVVLIDYLKNCPGKKIADIHVLVSTFDVDGVIKAAKEYKVDGIVTAGTDQPVYSAAIASEKLGLKFYLDGTTAKAVTNKIIMKDIFKKNNIPTVDYTLVGKDHHWDKSAIKYPAVLKPVDCQGQRGIFLVKEDKEVIDLVDETLSFSREDNALLETYYENDEITVNGWVKDGKTIIISVVDRVTIRRDKHIGICLCHHFPSLHYRKYKKDIKNITEQIVSAFNIKNGPLYFQYLVGADGIKVNEIAMRVGGAYEGLTIPIIAKVDILKMVVDYALGKKIDMQALDNYSIDNNDVYLSTQLFFCNSGTIDSMTSISQIKKMHGVREAYYEFKIGDTIGNLENATARAGYIIIEGTSFEDMLENVNKVFDAIKILDSTGNNLIIKYKDYKDKYMFVDGSDHIQ